MAALHSTMMHSERADEHGDESDMQREAQFRAAEVAWLAQGRQGARRLRGLLREFTTVGTVAWDAAAEAVAEVRSLALRRPTCADQRSPARSSSASPR